MSYTLIRALIVLVLAFADAGAACGAVPETVTFPSSDGKTTLTGYLFKSETAGRSPAIVLLHGRSGPYSSLARGTYTARTLTLRHRMWGEFWARHGYVALLVDSFGSRGYPAGFPKHSYSDRPAEVSERFVRPLDAYGALAYLRSRDDVVRDRIGLHGWSNGGMTVLSTLGVKPAGSEKGGVTQGFQAALAQYPSCRTQVREYDYAPYAPLLVLSGTDDDEVSYAVCRNLVELLRGRGYPVELVLYEGAQHAYDDPGKRKQSQEANREALRDSLVRAEQFFARHLKGSAAAESAAQ